MKIRVYPYKQGSASAKVLAEALGGKVLRHVGSKFKPKLGDVVINWGSSNPPNFAPATTLNKDVTVAQCKLATLDKLQAAGVRVPMFTTNKHQVLDNHLEGWPVICRTKLRGHSGDGIVVANNADELVDAPLYTKYVKKKDEYRVHVCSDGDDGAITFFIQRKARKFDAEEPNWQIRNLAGGFVFVKVGADEVPQDVINQAENALLTLGLDFGGVDVIWNEHEGKAYVLEINTACGLEERTAERYKVAMDDLVAA